MSNYLLVVLNVDAERAMSLINRELAAFVEKLNLWRSPLHDISWLIRAMNETITRQANADS